MEMEIALVKEIKLANNDLEVLKREIDGDSSIMNILEVERKKSYLAGLKKALLIINNNPK